jgi:hypothetical protein
MGEYNPRRTAVRPSPRVAERLREAALADPDVAVRILAFLPTDDDAIANVVKQAYEGSLAEDGTGGDRQIKEWLKFNTAYFSDELLGQAGKVKDDARGYISIDSENTVLALATHDWERAHPLIDRYYRDSSQPVTQVLATWALYKHAICTRSTSDIERYRSELMAIVENDSLPDGVRDKANDAITHEEDFPGRVDWTVSLLENEKLARMTSYTMLTTLMMYSPTDEYIDKLAGVLDKTSKPYVRGIAVRSLVIGLQRPSLSQERRKTAIKAMLPWLADPTWAAEAENGRGREGVIRALASLKVPEAVPALIKLLDEKHKVNRPDYSALEDTAAVRSTSNVNTVMRAANGRASLSTGVGNVASPFKVRQVEEYTFRDAALAMLGFAMRKKAAFTCCTYGILSYPSILGRALFGAMMSEQDL